MAYPIATRHGAMLLRAHGLTVREIADRIGSVRHGRPMGPWRRAGRVSGVRAVRRDCSSSPPEVFIASAIPGARAHREGLQGPAPAIDRETCRLCGEDLGDGRRGRGYRCREHAAKGWRVFGRLERRPAI